MKKDAAIKLAQDGLAELNVALECGKSETLQKYLDVFARFHNYSFNNCLLIAMQRPDATQVAGFHRWKQLGRFVKKGESGIGIFAPMVYRNRSEDAEQQPQDDSNGISLRGFKVVHVFDVSQTEGEELPEFTAVVGDPGANLQRLEQVIAEHCIQLDYEFIDGGALGVSRKGSIAVRPDLSPAETFSVLAHELAHERLHQRNGERETTKTVRETEAEAVAQVVCRAFGIDSTTRSADYIQLYRGDEKTLFQSLDYIQKTAAEMIDAIRDIDTDTLPSPAQHEQAQSSSPA